MYEIIVITFIGGDRGREAYGGLAPPK